MDKASGRNEMNSGSDSAKHYTGTAHTQHAHTPNTGPAAPTTGPSAQVVRDLAPTAAGPRSAVK